MHFWMIQGAKKMVLVCLICWNDLILHIVIGLNVFQLSAILFSNCPFELKRMRFWPLLPVWTSFWLVTRVWYFYLIGFLLSSNKVHLFKYIRTIKKCSNNSTSYEVEDKCDSTLQFSTSVEPTAEKIVRVSVRGPKVMILPAIGSFQFSVRS